MLPFRIDYVSTVKVSDRLVDKRVEAIDPESALESAMRIALVVDSVSKHFDQKTKRSVNYGHDGRRPAGVDRLNYATRLRRVPALRPCCGRELGGLRRRLPVDRLVRVLVVRVLLVLGLIGMSANAKHDGGSASAHGGVTATETSTERRKESTMTGSEQPGRRSATLSSSSGELLTVEQAADYLNITDHFVRRLIRERRIPFLKVGRLGRHRGVPGGVLRPGGATMRTVI